MASLFPMGEKGMKKKFKVFFPLFVLGIKQLCSNFYSFKKWKQLRQKLRRGMSQGAK